MTPMKALPMLDHVMLWVARVFAVVSMVPGVCFLFFAGEMFLVLLSGGWQWNNKEGPMFIAFFSYALVSILLTMGVWFPQRKLCRICLVVSAGLLFGNDLSQVPVQKQSGTSNIELGLVLALGLLVFSPFFWVAVRPPKKGVHSVCLP